MLVPPNDVAADHAALGLVAGVVGAVEGEVTQGGELGLDPVQPGAVGRGVGDLDVVRRRPRPDPLASLRRQVWRVVVGHDRDPHVQRVQRAQVAAELQECGAVLGLLNVPVELDLGEVVGGEQVPDAVRAGVGRPSARPGLPVRVLVLPAAFGPLPAGGAGG